jgi:putative addiction module component (TIGR02574 family)
MSESEVATMLSLSVEERMRPLERIWDSLATASDHLPLSDAHRALLDERSAEHAKDPGDVMTREAVLAAARVGRRRASFEAHGRTPSAIRIKTRMTAKTENITSHRLLLPVF